MIPKLDTELKKNGCDEVRFSTYPGDNFENTHEMQANR